ncbi:MAG: response regulator [Nitrospinae bacterium]|nr:response regulator [Nitrospinota bacterium]
MGDKPKILVVDDDFIVRSVLSDILESTEKYEALQAENGLEGLAQVESNPGISLIITDVNMPEMDGLAMLRELRKKKSQYAGGRLDRA